MVITGCPTGQSLTQEIKEVVTYPMRNPEELQDGEEPALLETSCIARPQASLTFSQLQKCMEERLEIPEPEATNCGCGLISDLRAESPKKDEFKNTASEPSTEPLLQQEANFQFNAVLVELLAMVPQDCTPKLLHPIDFSNLSPTTSTRFQFKKHGANAKNEVLADKKYVTVTEAKEESEPPPQYSDHDTEDRIANYVSAVITCDCLENMDRSDVKQELDSSSQTDLIFLKDGLTDNQGTGHSLAEEDETGVQNDRNPDTEEEPDPSNERDVFLDYDVVDGLSDSKIAANELVSEKTITNISVAPEIADRTDEVEVEIINNLSIGRITYAKDEPDPADEIFHQEVDCLEDSIGSQETANNSGSEETFPSSDHGLCADALDIVYSPETINDSPPGELADHRPEADLSDFISIHESQDISASGEETETTHYQPPFDVSGNSTSSQKIPDNEPQKELDISDQTEEVLTGNLDELQSNQLTQNTLELPEKPDSTFPSSGTVQKVLTELIQLYANSTYSREKLGPVGSHQTEDINPRDCKTFSQKAINNSTARNGPNPVDQRDEVKHDVLHSFPILRITTTNLEGKKRSSNTDINNVDALTPSHKGVGSQEPDRSDSNQETVTKLYTQEPELATLMNGFNIREKILNWESKGKSILTNEDGETLKLSNSPRVSKGFEELRKKFQSTPFSTEEERPEGRSTGCNALRFLFS